MRATSSSTPQSGHVEKDRSTTPRDSLRIFYHSWQVRLQLGFSISVEMAPVAPPPPPPPPPRLPTCPNFEGIIEIL